MADQTFDVTRPGVGQHLDVQADGSTYEIVEIVAYSGAATERVQTHREIAGLIPSSAKTTTQITADQVNTNGTTAYVYLNVTSAGTGSITLEVDEKVPTGGGYNALLTGVAVVANGLTVYRIGPGLTAAANSVVNLAMPRTFRVVVTANNANPVTYSVDVVLCGRL